MPSGLGGATQINLASKIQSDIDSISTEGAKATYSAGSTINAASSATDVAILVGSASKTIRVRKVYVYLTATAAGHQLMLLNKRSTDDTGGTSVALVGTPYDSNDTAATATARVYSVNPTVGTLTGAFQVVKIAAAIAGTATYSASVYEETFGGANERSIVLRGTNEALAINFNGTILSGLNVTFYFVWTEE